VSPAQNPQAIREALERVLSSACFARSERASKLLRFLVERRLDDRDSELKESIIGVEVFGRKPDYDPKADSTVRSEAVRLRGKLTRYYATEGTRDQLVIELPKGGYVPTFRPLEMIPAATPPGRRMPRLVVGLAAFTVITAAIGVWWILNRNAPIRIGVLPLVDTSQDSASDYLADGLTSEIINDLSIIQGLAVRSQTSSFSLKGQRPSAHDAGSRLRADYILEGSIMRSGERLRINTQLVRARDDVPVWSGRFEPELTDIISVQDEISRGIVNSLRLKLGQGQRRYEAKAEAYDLYLQARACQIRIFPGDPEVIERFEKVIAKDPSFAPAYAGLAAAHAWRSGVGVAAPEQADSLKKMRVAAEKAIQLDPLLAEAHCALGAAYARDGKWRQAEETFRRAIEIGPNVSSAHGLFANFVLRPLNRIAESVREMRTAESNDPLSPEAHEDLASVLLSAGRFDEAAQQCELIPAGALYRNQCLGRAWLCQGRMADAIRALSDSTINWGYLANAYARAGRRAEAEKLIAEGPSLHPNQRGPFQFALAFAGFKDKDRTLEPLERLARVGPVRIGYTLASPEFAFLRGDLRAKALRKKVGLPE
jgi:TolB-like protein